jgi:hypothetical protein
MSNDTCLKIISCHLIKYGNLSYFIIEYLGKRSQSN